MWLNWPVLAMYGLCRWDATISSWSTSSWPQPAAFRSWLVLVTISDMSRASGESEAREPEATAGAGTASASGTAAARTARF